MSAPEIFPDGQNVDYLADVGSDDNGWVQRWEPIGSVLCSFTHDGALWYWIDLVSPFWSEDHRSYVTRLVVHASNLRPTPDYGV